MARKDFQSTVADALPRVIREQAKNSTGSIKFTHADKKTVGRVFVKAGNIYAIELSTYAPKIVSRIATNEYISDANREQVIAEFGERLTDLKVVQFVLQYQIFPEKPLITYLKDYFFDAFDELYQWKDVSVEWRNGEEPSDGVLKVPAANPDLIIEKLKQREQFLREQISGDWSIHPRDLDDVRYRRNFEYEDPDYTNMLILGLPTEDELPIGYVADYLGLPKFNAKLALYNLWKTGAVDVFNPSGLWYSNRSEEEIKNSAPLQLSDIQTRSVPVTPVSEEIFEAPTVIEEEAVEEMIEAITPYEEEVEELYEPEPLVLNTVSEEVSSEEYDYDYLQEEAVDSNPIYTGLTAIADDYNYENQAPQVEKVNTEYTIEKEPAMSTPVSATGNSAASRLRELKEQIRLELSSLQQNITETQKTVRTKEQYVQHLHSERNSLVAKLKELDKTITSEAQAIKEGKAEVARLQEEFNENSALLN